MTLERRRGWSRELHWRGGGGGVVSDVGGEGRSHE